ncbi:hypothetical protein HNR40_002827 [Nonomuraea endophytica]|uniref:Uncharacterized protein n=1 Tax=Nonomuraea endophytica TaxID=714136 RepID=A0A7W8A0R7_9ACTN|nr:hypothetical protein [Nonomuraea endophytica]
MVTLGQGSAETAIALGIVPVGPRRATPMVIPH